MCCIVGLMMPSGLITRSHPWPAWSSGTACLKPTCFHNYCYAGRTTRSTLGVELNNNDQHLEQSLPLLHGSYNYEAFISSAVQPSTNPLISGDQTVTWQVNHQLQNRKFSTCIPLRRHPASLKFMWSAAATSSRLCRASHRLAVQRGC